MNKVFLFLLALIISFSCSQKEAKKIDGDEMLNALIKEKYDSKAVASNGMYVAGMLGSKKQPIRLYMTQSRAESVMREKLQSLLDFLKAETDMHFELHVPDNYDEMIMAFATGEAHFALMNSLSFVKVREAYGAYAELKIIRFKTSTYFGQIIARAELEIEDVQGLSGRSIAYADTSSASGYLYPNNMLAQKGITLGKVVFAGSHANVVRMIYNGEVDAGATFYLAPDKEGNLRDGRSRVLDEYEDVAKKVTLVTVTRPIPNDPIVFASHIDKKLAYKICNLLIKFMSTPQAKTSLGEIYGIDGFVRCNNEDYNILKEALQLKDSLTSQSAPTS